MGVNPQLDDFGYRYDFDGRLNLHMPIIHNTARCHSISYITIMGGISEPVNRCIDKLKTIQDCENYLTGLCNAVFCKQVPPLYTDAKFIYDLAETSKRQIIQELTMPQLNYAQILDSANKLLYCLNSALSNLRYGYSSWNSSIREAFDPVLWAHTNAQGHFDSSNQGVLGGGAPPGFPAVLVGANSYYIYSASDNVRLDEVTTHTIGKSFYLLKAVDVQTGMKFLYSSSNTFAIPASTYDQDIAYYLSPANTWVSF
jgi:hypothetical protein